MKQQEVFKKIGGIIQEINDQYEYLQGTPEHLNDLELELFVANTHFLKDHAEILRKLNAIKSEPLQLPKHEEPKPEPIKPAPPKPEEPKTTISNEPKWFEPVVQPLKPAAERASFKPEPPKPAVNNNIQFEFTRPQDEPAPQINLKPDTETDNFSFEREEPEVIRHELILDEADSYEEEEKENLPQTEQPLMPVAVIEPKPDIEPYTEPEIKPEPTPEIAPEPAVEPEILPEPEPVTVPEPVIEIPKPAAESPKVQIESMEAIQVESLKAVTEKPAAIPDEPLTLNQRLSAQLKEKEKAPALNAEVIEPLADIKKAINLNDKLLFVKDLFNGYNLAYTEAIEIVNRFSNFEEADRFLRNNYVTKNNWEAKKSTSDKFYALLKRRYA